MSEQTPPTPHNSKTGLAVATGVVVLLIILAVVKFSGKEDDIATTPETITPTTNEQTTTTRTYKDGTYTATGAYTSPGGPETIVISLTLKGGVVTDATAQPQAEQPISKKMQQAFSQNFRGMIVGKNINEVTLDKVSGSSLTPKGFNDAVEQIKTQAAISA